MPEFCTLPEFGKLPEDSREVKNSELDPESGQKLKK